MNRTKTQLNVVKNVTFTNPILIKFQLLCLICSIFFLSFTAQAQTSNCPEGDPLQWDWIQNLILNRGWCEISDILQFELEGNIYFHVRPGGLDSTTNLPCPAIDSGQPVYSCNGELVCKTGFISPDNPISCQTILNPRISGNNPTTTIWNSFGISNVEISLGGCPGDIFELQVALYDQAQAICIPAGQQVEIVTPSNEPVITNFMQVDDCNIAVTFNREGEFIYTAATGKDSDETITWTFKLFYNPDCTNIPGCNDPAACNYIPVAGADDGTCTYDCNGNEILATYPWLSAYFNPNDCTDERIIVYNKGLYNFVLIQNGNEGKLYFEDGTFYCDETPSCLEAYGLSNVAQTWTCGNNNTPLNGCTDSNAINYNPLATEDDGSCKYSENANCHIDDWTALKALYENTSGDNWINNTGWEEVKSNEPTANCNLDLLYGVKLKSRRIIELKLQSNQLNGNIPAELVGLVNLKVLFLEKNQLNGNIPNEIGNLGSLIGLNLSDNQLSGDIPPELSNLTNLIGLVLSNNELSGGIPKELGRLSKLEGLSISGNDMAGCFPNNLRSLCEQFTNLSFDNSYIDNGNNFDAFWEDFCANESGACTTTSTPVTGCTALNAINYNPSATEDDGSCEYENTVCPEGEPLQWHTVQSLINRSLGSGCGITEIRQFAYNGNYYLEAIPGTTVEGLICSPDKTTSYYRCYGEYVCDRYGMECDQELLIASGNSTIIWRDENNIQTATCPVGDPLQWDWIQDIINSESRCSAAEIREFEYNGNTYIETVVAEDKFGFPCQADTGNSYFTCTGEFICNLGLPNPNRICDPGLIAAADNYTTLWTYQNVEDSNPSPIFQDFPWLNTYINQSNCNGENITVYDTGYYNFILIQNGNEGKLYFENGTFYCNETPTYSCVAAYGFNNVAQTWTCGNNATPTPPSTISGCTDVNATNYNVNATEDDGSCEYENTNVLVFSTFPWLSTYVNQSNCNGESITVYNTGYYNFILIENGNEGKLYFENGTYYCDETVRYSCVAAYGLNNVTQTWTCENSLAPPLEINGCTDANATNYNTQATTDDGSCEYENTGTCSSNIGTFFFEYCGGISYYFIRLDDGRVFDPYFAEGIEITPEEGQQIHFDYVIKKNVTTPCTISESPITITCFETIERSIFNEFSWLSTLVDTNNCGDASISLYDGGGYYFIYVQTASGNNLYYQDGTFYCSDAPGYSCRTLYKLTNAELVWNCSGSNTFKKSQPAAASNLIKVNNFNIYPNPANNKVNIGLSNASIYEINLINTSGKVMKQLKTGIDDKIVELNVSDLPKGMYLVELRNDSNSNIQKLVIE